jgi:polyisoprenyl-phosphate glycosyltransferase
VKIVILTPVYNDWPSLTVLLEKLRLLLANKGDILQLLIVDDASAIDGDNSALAGAINYFEQAHILRLRVNLGHQRAIAVGLTWIHNHMPTDAVLILDSDGEDRPDDAPILLETFAKYECRATVFAQRRRRSEGLVFSVFYRLYQIFHWLLTGLPVRIGNFSIIPGAFVQKIVICGYLWNHYAATVERLKLPRVEVPTTRGRRYAGTSQMNFVSLVKHGLSAIAVHSEVVGVRLLVACAFGSALALIALIVCTWIRCFTNLAIAGWATYVSGFAIVILIQMLSLTLSFCIRALSNQNDALFVPLRDCDFYVETCTELKYLVQHPV